MKIRFKLVAPAWCSAKLPMKTKFSSQDKWSFLTCLFPLEMCFAPCSVRGCSVHTHRHPAGSEGCPCRRHSDKQERPVCLNAMFHIGERHLYQHFYKRIHRKDKFSKFFLLSWLGMPYFLRFQEHLISLRLYTTIFRDPSFKPIAVRHLHLHVQFLFVQKLKDFFCM